MYSDPASPLTALSKADVTDLMVECAGSLKMTARVLFPERFYAPFAPLHDQIFEAIESGERKIAIAAPRGMGKTSIVGLALAGQSLLFRTRNFIPYVSKSFDNSMMQTENLKHELATNKMVKAFFGNVKTKTADDVLDEQFSKKAWVGFNTLVLPRGSGQQVRGILYRNYRPDLIIIDDLEDPDTIENDEQRRKRKTWFHADLEKCVSRISRDWQLVYIDTLKHEDALLQDLLDSAEWCSIRLELCDDSLRSNMPEFVTDEEVKKEHAYHQERGMLDVFYREYRNLPISTEDAVFDQRYFKYYEEHELLEQKSKGEIHVENIILVDPAKTVKIHSAETAIICVGIDTKGNRLYVRDIVAERMYPDDIYNHIFLMAARFNTRVVGVEVTSLNEFITQPIKNEMTRRGQFFELVELKPRGGEKKEHRVKALQPYYRQGLIYHNSACAAGLESQLLSFPRSKRWDIMDALAYVIYMLDVGDRYFEAPESEDPEDEFNELDYEPAVEGWEII